MLEVSLLNAFKASLHNNNITLIDVIINTNE